MKQKNVVHKTWGLDLLDAIDYVIKNEKDINGF